MKNNHRETVDNKKPKLQYKRCSTGEGKDGTTAWHATKVET